MYKLILVDDETLVLRQLSIIINWNEIGFELAGTYTNSREALEHLKTRDTDVLISDIKMPHFSGLELAQYCYENKPSIYVVLLSAYRDFEYAKTAIQYNVHDYITKPITQDSLISVLKKLYCALSTNLSCQPVESFLAHIRYQTLFSNLLCGNIESPGEVQSYFSQAHLPLEYCNAPGVLIHIQLLHLDQYLNSVWKHGIERLFNAIGMLVTSQSEHYCFSMIRTLKNTIEVIGLISDKSRINAICKQYHTELMNNLHNLLKLEFDYTVVNCFENLSDFAGSNAYANESSNDIVDKVTEYIKANYKNDISLEDAARHVSLSRVYLCSYYNKHSPESFTDTLNNVRLEKAKEELKKNDAKISVLHELVGYKSKTYFYKIFKDKYKVTPGEYRDLYLKGIYHE